MAKDPAFLFYTQDFIIGTQMMTDEQVGIYIRLLCMQHQVGRMTENHMKFICKSYDNDVYSKFKRDENGLYYNERLEEEALKRKKFCESRGRNREGKNNISNSYDSHMENEIENTVLSNIKEETKKREKFVKPERDDIITYLTTEKNKDEFTAMGFADRFINFYESKGWKIGKNTMVSWKAAIGSWLSKDQEESKPKPKLVFKANSSDK